MLVEGQKGVQSKSKGAKKCIRRARPSDMEEESDTEDETEKKKSVKNRRTLPQSSADDDSDFDIPTQRTQIQSLAASGLEVIPQCSVIAH